jgi:hypothetical protein
MTKVTIIDTLSFREANKFERQRLLENLQSVNNEITTRFTDTEMRLGSTTDETTLQKLDAFKKFLRAVSERIDEHVIFINRAVEIFDAIDEVYWNTVINGQKLADENENLKLTIAGLQRQRDISVEGWKEERRRWNRNRLIKTKAA